ncbi:pyridoxal phosphate-dependent aminotransferase [Janibacter anophelis]|uniref:pyridoxal phosphate-dependent aminotransferase n=1 Tax=Janibacter anophelis TaxID=319054 RepID=UPI00082BC26D|nr:pyridoxal phosphate-dependent aminotransferase [Janibacter anophelis]
MSDPLVSRMQPHAETIFATMSALALEHGAINLGQGFPDTDGPAEVLEAARDAIDAGHNQYPPTAGIPALREAIAAHQARHHSLRPDPADEVLVTSGATEAIAAAVLGLVTPGDEVVVIEPSYDSYAAVIALAGGVRRTVPLRFPDLSLDPQQLAAAFSDRTRVVVVNSPHNPTGKVFTPDELALVADLARRHDAWVLSDEVYEHLTFGVPHVPIATLPGMWERTLTVGSAGKFFSVTGWKVGWLTGPAPLVRAARAVHQYLTFTTASPLQHAVARALDLGPAPLDELRDSLRDRHDLLVDGLRDAGLEVRPSQGTYFVIADAAALGVDDAVQWCLRLPADAGVAAVPVSVFCDDPTATASLVRFAFCKQAPVLEEACRRLAVLTA